MDFTPNTVHHDSGYTSATSGSDHTLSNSKSNYKKSSSFSDKRILTSICESTPAVTKLGSRQLKRKISFGNYSAVKDNRENEQNAANTGYVSNELTHQFEDSAIKLKYINDDDISQYSPPLRKLAKSKRLSAYKYTQDVSKTDLTQLRNCSFTHLAECFNKKLTSLKSKECPSTLTKSFNDLVVNENSQDLNDLFGDNPIASSSCNKLNAQNIPYPSCMQNDCSDAFNSCDGVSVESRKDTETNDDVEMKDTGYFQEENWEDRLCVTPEPGRDSKDINDSQKSNSEPSTPTKQDCVDLKEKCILRKYNSFNSILTSKYSSLVKIGTPEKNNLLYPELKPHNNLKSPKRIRITRKKIGKLKEKKTDFLKLFHKKFPHILSKIFSYVDDNDLVSICAVSRTGEKAVLADKRATQRRKTYLKYIVFNKENISRTTEIELKESDKNVSLPRKNTVIVSEENKGNESLNSPSKREFLKYFKATQTLKPGEYLTKCIHCENPARVRENIVQCLREICQVSYCKNCLSTRCVSENRCSSPSSPRLRSPIFNEFLSSSHTPEPTVDSVTDTVHLKPCSNADFKKYLNPVRDRKNLNDISNCLNRVPYACDEIPVTYNKSLKMPLKKRSSHLEEKNKQKIVHSKTEHNCKESSVVVRRLDFGKKPVEDSKSVSELVTSKITSKKNKTRDVSPIFVPNSPPKVKKDSKIGSKISKKNLKRL